MNLYRIEYDVEPWFNTYDAAVVVANTADEARGMHPSGDDDRWGDGSWASDPTQVSVTLLCEVTQYFAPEVVLASYIGS